MLLNKWIKRFGITVLLTTLCLLIIGAFVPYEPSSSTASGLFWHNKIHPAKQFDVVVAGDSRIYRGIDPTSIEAVFSEIDTVSVFNFGFSSVGLDSAYLSDAVRLLDSNATRPILIIGVSPSALADENMANTHYYQEKNRTFSEQFQRRYLNTFLSYFDPSSPELLRNQVLDNKHGYFQQHFMNGWIASEKFPEDVWQDLWMLEDGFKKAVWSVHYQIKLVQLIAGWENKGIEVFAFRPPASAHFERAENDLSQVAEQALATQIEAVGGTWLNVQDRYQYATYDGSHLKKASAQLLSKRLAQQIVQHMQDSAVRLVQSVNLMEGTHEDSWSTLPASHCSSDAFDGATSNFLPLGAFSSTYQYPLKELNGRPVRIKASCKVKTASYAASEGAFLVISIEKNDSTWVWEAQPIQQQLLDSMGWNAAQHTFDISVPEEEALLKIYVWNNSTTTLKIDDFEVALTTPTNYE